VKILLVDDHILFREGMALLLQPLASPMTIVDAGSTEEALLRLDEHPDTQLVVMDLGLPGMPGLGGIALIRERHPNVPVVALSSADDKATVLQALDAGAMGFVPKSSTAPVMLAALRLILSSGIYLPPSVFLNSEGTTPLPAGSRRPTDLGLTARQADVLQLILQGKPAKLICRELGLSAGTVKSHTSAVLRALNVTTRTQAVVAAGRLGLKFDGART
jgi:DNA-binding NarL/FixJ family response regulator